jgi:hypothetical protein
MGGGASVTFAQGQVHNWHVGVLLRHTLAITIQSMIETKKRKPRPKRGKTVNWDCPNFGSPC